MHVAYEMRTGQFKTKHLAPLREYRPEVFGLFIVSCEPAGLSHPVPSPCIRKSSFHRKEQIPRVNHISDNAMVEVDTNILYFIRSVQSLWAKVACGEKVLCDSDIVPRCAVPWHVISSYAVWARFLPATTHIEPFPFRTYWVL